jgi:hypothetical protein
MQDFPNFIAVPLEEEANPGKLNPSKWLWTEIGMILLDKCDHEKSYTYNAKSKIPLIIFQQTVEQICSYFTKYSKRFSTTD